MAPEYPVKAIPAIADEYTRFEGKACIVMTSTGAPVSIGRLKVTPQPTLAGVGVRVELHFDTEDMSCILGIGPDKLASLNGSWTGEVYRYVLPPGEKVWLPKAASS